VRNGGVSARRAGTERSVQMLALQTHSDLLWFWFLNRRQIKKYQYLERFKKKHIRRLRGFPQISKISETGTNS
jgi:hypothetical protein